MAPRAGRGVHSRQEAKSAMKHVVHYPVLSAGQVLHTLGRGTASDQLLEVVSTARYSPPGATEGKGTEGHQVLQVAVKLTIAEPARPVLRQCDEIN